MIKKLVGFFALPALLFCLHLVMVFLGLYKAHPWIDIPMHVLGGVFIAYSFSLAVTYFQQRKILSELNVLSGCVFLFALTSLATVIWEFGEFTLDSLFDTVAQASLADTMLDMFLGLVGGAALIVFLTRAEIKDYLTKDKTPQ
jgi:hypothetical protein